jgi:hypothetical protein
MTKKAIAKPAKKTATVKTKKKSASQNPSPKTTPKRKTRQSDFKSQAMVYDGPTLPVTMDTTAHDVISIMLNEKFSKELFDDADKIFNLGKLDNLKQKKSASYLKEGKKQILGLWHNMESFAAHSDLFRTSFLIAIGKVLNHIEESFKKKSEYMNWLRENFRYKHLRYFQHAKQLDRMGAFARNYASLGKNRLLELERTRKELGKSFNDLFTQFPFRDTTADHDGDLFKEHVDGIVTYHRLQKAGVGCVDFDQAALIGAQLNGAITVKMATEISKWLADKRNKSQALDDLILNKLSYPDREIARSANGPSIRKYLADLINYSESLDYENDQWASALRDQVDDTDLKKAYDFIVTLAGKLGINLRHPTVRSRGRRAA